MQAVLCLQREKAEAGVEAALWKVSSQAAQGRVVDAEASRIKVEGQLQAKRNEVHGLQQAFAQQSEVRSQIYGLKSSWCLVYPCKIIQSNTAMSCLCVCAGCLLSLQVPLGFFPTPHHHTSPHLRPCLPLSPSLSPPHTNHQPKFSPCHLLPFPLCSPRRTRPPAHSTPLSSHHANLPTRLPLEIFSPKLEYIENSVQLLRLSVLQWQACTCTHYRIFDLADNIKLARPTLCDSVRVIGQGCSTAQLSMHIHRTLASLAKLADSTC